MLHRRRHDVQWPNSTRGRPTRAAQLRRQRACGRFRRDLRPSGRMVTLRVLPLSVDAGRHAHFANVGLVAFPPICAGHSISHVCPNGCVAQAASVAAILVARDRTWIIGRVHRRHTCRAGTRRRCWMQPFLANLFLSEDKMVPIWMRANDTIKPIGSRDLRPTVH